MAKSPENSLSNWSRTLFPERELVRIVKRDRELLGLATASQAMAKNLTSGNPEFLKSVQRILDLNRSFEEALSPPSLLRSISASQATLKRLGLNLDEYSGLASFAAHLTKHHRSNLSTIRALSGISTRHNLSVEQLIGRNIWLDLSHLAEAIESSGTTEESAPPQDEEVLSWFREILAHLEEMAERADQIVTKRAVLRLLRWLVPLLVSVLLAQYYNRETEEDITRIEASIEQVDDKITNLPKPLSDDFASETIDRLGGLAERIEQLEQATSGSEFYVVVRPVHLTEEQRYLGTRGMLLVPGQEVQLVERAGKWIKVIAYDPTDDITKSGWVLKKYLRRVPKI